METKSTFGFRKGVESKLKGSSVFSHIENLCGAGRGRDLHLGSSQEFETTRLVGVSICISFENSSTVLDRVQSLSRRKPRFLQLGKLVLYLKLLQCPHQIKLYFKNMCG